MPTLKVSATPTPLAERMWAVAATGHPRASELRRQADAFDRAALRFHTVDHVTIFLPAWARARRLLTECTGEPLI